MLDRLPVFAVSGFSGSGKTTLIEKVVPTLMTRGLKVAVVKHDAHGIKMDTPGKDSDRLYQAGADILLQGPDETFFRSHGDSSSPDHKLANTLEETLITLCRHYDLVLVEGHKHTSLPRVWLLDDSESSAPENIEGIVATLSRDADRAQSLLNILDDWLHTQWLKTPVYGCILIGGKSSRMGHSKHIINKDGKTWLEHTTDILSQYAEQIVFAGNGAVPGTLSGYPNLPDVPNAMGPLAGMLAAMRWSPWSSWIVCACDMPNITPAAIEWLLAQRQPGCHGITPRLENQTSIEPLLAWYDFRATELFESMVLQQQLKLQQIAMDGAINTPTPPEHLQSSWENINTPTDLAQLSR